MDIRPLSPTYAVSPQIAPEDMDTLVDQGFGTVICNRPNMENPPQLFDEVIKSAAEGAGLAFESHPVVGSGLTLEDVKRQADMIAASEKPVLAYCASGTRSAVLWAFAMAGSLSTDEILASLSKAGYQLEGLRGQIDALAAQG